ncbi:MAG: 16S rRNA (cytosine(967)-C(5))-methyltransferase RsmB [Chthoniobacterales bacterium]
MNARAVALAALNEWRRGRQFADTILQRLLGQHSLGESDRAFATELFYGVLRNLTLLDFWIDHLREAALDHASRDLLRLGLYQIFLLQTPQHAAVFETVELSGRRNRGLINGVLRAALRRQEELRAAAETAPLATRCSHPEFLIERWTTAFDAEAVAALCDWNNQPAPLYARVNRLRGKPEAFSNAEPIPGKENFVHLKEIPTDALARGDCYIQDPSTALACELLDPQPNESILDACAAPGGKSAYVAELMENRGELVACDRDPARLHLLRENLDRLGVTNTAVVRQDWRDQPLSLELRERKFDRILIDAPCTNTGVMRRRVDVRWRLRPDDFAHMPREQLAILRAVLPLLNPGGVLVYSTCSIDAEENENVVRCALEEFPDLRLEEQKSVLPWRDHFDGAFAARLALVLHPTTPV